MADQADIDLILSKTKLYRNHPVPVSTSSSHVFKSMAETNRSEPGNSESFVSRSSVQIEPPKVRGKIVLG